MSGILSKPPVVIDNGTGYTKMGYAGNYEPNFIIPRYVPQHSAAPRTVPPIVLM